MLKWKGFVAYFSHEFGGGEVLSRDAEITIPDEGITLKHGDEVVATIEPPDVEVVTDESGVILYLNLPLTEENRKWMINMLNCLD